jgi:hypothetical protein
MCPLRLRRDPPVAAAADSTSPIRVQNATNLDPEPRFVAISLLNS